jgi:hypothetical protein
MAVTGNSCFKLVDFKKSSSLAPLGRLIPEGLPGHSPVATSLQNTRGFTRSQSSHGLHPKYRRYYQLTIHSPLPSKIPEGLPGHSPVAASLQNTGGFIRSQSSSPTFTSPPPCKIPEGLPGHSSVAVSLHYTGGTTRSLSNRHLPPKYWRDYQVTVQQTSFHTTASLQNTGVLTRSQSGTTPFTPPPSSKIPEGLPGHNPVTTFHQNTGGITRSQSRLRLPPNYCRDYQVTVQSPPPSKILEG